MGQGQFGRLPKPRLGRDHNKGVGAKKEKKNKLAAPPS